jgi:transcriptional regulator of nitric oxide reductase
VRYVLGLVGIVVATVSVAWAADRIFTNPKPDQHLKKLFPKAVAFSTLEGTPLHFRAFAEDPKKNPSVQPIGYAFWTTDIMPNERGYHAAMHFLVGMDLQGVLTGVALDYDSEPYGYFSIQPPEFVAQFTGKSIRDPFRIGQDIDAVSRATITMEAAARVIRESSRTMARQFLNPAAVKKP